MAVELIICIDYSMYKLMLEQSRKLQELSKAPRREEIAAEEPVEKQDSAATEMRGAS
jgi:hypothetical protein